MNLSHMTFGHWEVLGIGGRLPPKTITWSCRCECGVIKDVRQDSLRQGKSISCGCLKTTHGMSKSHEYFCWKGMRQRCQNSKDPNFHNYGGRGISVSSEWDTFTNFLRDMGASPSAVHELERMDNHGNYEHGNVKWATRGEQNINKRTNLRIWHNGTCMTASEWIRRTGISKSAFYQRLGHGWSISRTIETPWKQRALGGAA